MLDVPPGQHLAHFAGKVLVVEGLAVRAGARQEAELPDQSACRHGSDEDTPGRQDPFEFRQSESGIRDVFDDLGAEDRSEASVGEGQVLDVAFDDLVTGEALTKQRDVARIDVDPDRARGKVAQVQAGPAPGIQDR